MLQNPIGRPSKLDGHVNTCLREMYEDDDLMSVICTDEELFILLNDRLQPEHQVSYRTFQRYKVHAKRYGEEGVPRDIDRLYTDLYNTMKRFAIKQKVNLVRNMMDCEPTQCHRYKWMLERKYKDFNMKYQIAAFLKDDEEEKIAIEFEAKQDPTVWVDCYGNNITDWHKEYFKDGKLIRRPHEDPPHQEHDDMLIYRSRYYEKFKGKTGNKPNKDDVDLYYYWPEGIERPDWTQDELDAWFNHDGKKVGTPQAKPKAASEDAGSNNEKNVEPHTCGSGEREKEQRHAVPSTRDSASEGGQAHATTSANGQATAQTLKQVQGDGTPFDSAQGDNTPPKRDTTADWAKERPVDFEAMRREREERRRRELENRPRSRGKILGYM